MLAGCLRVHAFRTGFSLKHMAETTSSPIRILFELGLLTPSPYLNHIVLHNHAIVETAKSVNQLSPDILVH